MEVRGLRRAALADPKVARARAIPPDTLLLTAKSRGVTALHVWDGAADPLTYSIHVVAKPSNSAFGRAGTSGVVKVSLVFLELAESARSQTGVRWPDGFGMTGGASVHGTVSQGSLQYSVSLSGARGWMRQLVTQGHAKILSQPELYVRLGEQASFSSGGELPVPTTSENFGRFQRHIEWKPYGTRVAVRPDSADGYHLQSDVDVELSELDSAVAVEGIPGLNRRRLSTKIDSLDGETVLLSGLVRRLSSLQTEGLPVLKDLPVLGLFFSERSQSSESNEILMALTLSVASRAGAERALERWQTHLGNAPVP